MEFESKNAKVLSTMGTVCLLGFVIIGVVCAIPLFDDYTWRHMSEKGYFTVVLPVVMVLFGIVLKCCISGFAIVVEKCYRDMKK